MNEKRKIIKISKLVLFKCNKILAEAFVSKLRRKRGKQSCKWQVRKFMSRVGANLSNDRADFNVSHFNALLQRARGRNSSSSKHSFSQHT